MIQHHSCLYCGKEFKTSSLTCDCVQSKIKVVEIAKLDLESWKTGHQFPLPRFYKKVQPPNTYKSGIDPYDYEPKDEGKSFVYSNHHFSKFNKKEMTPLQRQDLIYYAKQLPKVEPFDHEDMVIRHYEAGGWEKVMDYSNTIRLIASLETRRAATSSKITYYLSKTRSLFKL